MIYSMTAIAGLGFVVWGHHMFTSGMNPALGMTFMVSTVLIALPSGIKVFNWIGTLWGGHVRFNTVMLNCAAFVSMFITGGLSRASSWRRCRWTCTFHDTYFIVAHFPLHFVRLDAVRGVRGDSTLVPEDDGAVDERVARASCTSVR